ncbi:MAG: hypothetical protein KBS91_04955, partial [Firmicutes bacterium]|nr:hypothetical protein [Candidatus Caballimonas caccae]
MKTTKRITVIALYVALLLSAQFLLSGISGVEVVTVLFLSFCFVFGAVNGIIVATLFSIIRCFIFGFYPTVLIVYLIYYNLFALFFGLFGRKKLTKVRFVLV